MPFEYQTAHWNGRLARLLGFPEAEAAFGPSTTNPRVGLSLSSEGLLGRR